MTRLLFARWVFSLLKESCITPFANVSSEGQSAEVPDDHLVYL